MRVSARLAVAGLAAGLSLSLSVLVGARIAAAVMAGAAALRGLGTLGWGLFVGGEFLLTLVGVVPGALLGVAAGMVFGVVRGFLLSSVGIMAGAVAAFGLSRSFLRPWIGGLLRRSGLLARLDGMFAQQGWRIVALLRISPVMPFSVTSYALGFSGVLFRDYVFGTLASLPPLLGYVVIGALGARVKADVHVVLLALGVVATLALTVQLSRLLGRALRAA